VGSTRVLTGVFATILVAAILLSVFLFLVGRPVGYPARSTSSSSKTAVITIPSGYFNATPGFNATVLRFDWIAVIYLAVSSKRCG